MTMALQLAMVLGLFGLRRQLMSSLSLPDRRRGAVDPLFWAGVIAGILLFLFRFANYGAWYTGHLREFRLAG